MLPTVANLLRFLALSQANYRVFLLVDLTYNISCLFSTLNLTIEYTTHYHHPIFECNEEDMCNVLHDALYFLLALRMVPLCFVIIIWLIYCCGMCIRDDDENPQVVPLDPHVIEVKQFLQEQVKPFHQFEKEAL